MQLQCSALADVRALLGAGLAAARLFIGHPQPFLLTDQSGQIKRRKRHEYAPISIFFNLQHCRRRLDTLLSASVGKTLN